MSQILSAGIGIQADISRIVKYAPVELVGREDETKLLDEAWQKVARVEKGRLHVLTFVALGGEGKTSLVAKWAAYLAHCDWPGCDAVFAWSFYSQGTREQIVASSDLFLKEALTFFGDTGIADSAQGAFDKGRRLAQLVGERRALLILDGLEPLQYSPTSPTPGELKDQGLSALLKGLAATSRGLCVLTTRHSIADLRAFLGKTVREEKLARLAPAAGVALLKSLGVRGTPPEFGKLVEDVQGHALTLNLLGSYLRDAHAGDIRRRDLVKLEEADAEEHGGHAFRVMDAYVQTFEYAGKTADEQAKGRHAVAVLSSLGLFDRPASADCLNALWHGEPIIGLTEPLIALSEAQRNLSLKRLEDAKLLTVSRDEASGVLLALDAHPLLREYFARRVRGQQPEAWRAAHQRLYNHLCATTKEGDQPTLEGLQPLYQAVVHGCHAGLEEDARGCLFVGRIRRREEAYSLKKLGAWGSDLGAISSFFKNSWSELLPGIPQQERAWCLSEAAFCLRSLGRLTEALEPMRAALKLEETYEPGSSAAIAAGNLSELTLSLGNVAEAVQYASRSVTYANLGRAWQHRVTKRASHGDALHQSGDRSEAETRFRQAEQIQRGVQPEYPLLYSIQGFKFCDFLLAYPEHGAWRVMLNEASTLPNPSLEVKRGGETKALRAACNDVAHRAEETFKWDHRHRAGLLDLALAHLTLGRSALYSAILGDSGFQNLANELSHVETAVKALYRAATLDHIPRGLLTRAWLRFLAGPRLGPESAQSDLDEAWEIAARGPMPLFLADIHLYRARLFFRETTYPWNLHVDGTLRSAKEDLVAARRLIGKHGYWRRREELEDAEKALSEKRPAHV